MPFGLGIGQVVALVRETRGFEGALPQISVSGEGASELALPLSTGGDAGAVIVGSDPGQRRRRDQADRRRAVGCRDRHPAEDLAGGDGR